MLKVKYTLDSLTFMDLDEATIDDIRELRPDLYQEIVEDVLMGSFAGRTDEVFNIVVPAINEMRSEIADITEQLKHSLESIVEKEARARFKKLMQDIEKATVNQVFYKAGYNCSRQYDFDLVVEYFIKLKWDETEFKQKHPTAYYKGY